jgi:hypothetical protein
MNFGFELRPPIIAERRQAMRVHMVDVAISIRGKPLQTAVTLLSLLRHSGPHIGKVYFSIDGPQPFGADHSRIVSMLRERIVLHRPFFWLGYRPQRLKWLMRWRPYRHSLRYQYAWEASTANHLFITHNDVLYGGDVIGAMLKQIAGKIAVGSVGQCWNCPAHAANLCSPSTFQDYRPSIAEWDRIAQTHPGPRAAKYARVVDRAQPWPLPECRVNEWAMLVDLQAGRPLTIPFGKAVPLGTLYGLDTGTQWFHDVINAGAEVANFEMGRSLVNHAWASPTFIGNAALSDHSIYAEEERQAKEYLVQNHPEYFCD